MINLKSRTVCLFVLGSMLVVTGLFITHAAQSAAQAPTAKTFRAEATRARLARGKYLAEGPMHCFGCHSDVDWKTPGSPPVAGKKGAGTFFPLEDLPFKLVAPNITPDKETGAGTWTDEQFERALRQGIGHDGRRLFPVMPYLRFRQLSDEDLASVIVYLRSIPAVRHELPKTPIPPPIADSLPALPPTGPVPQPDTSTPAKRGAYLVGLGNCFACHTSQDEKGQPVMGLTFAGGNRFKGPWGEISAANITPDASGISYYDEKLFFQVMRTGNVRTRKLNALMPWGHYRTMTDEDLRAIFAYLKTLKPVQHRVDNTEPPTYCKVCKYKHGYGDKN